MEQDDKQVDSQVSEKTRKANLRLAIILGIIVLLGMSSTFFMLSEKL